MIKNKLSNKWQSEKEAFSKRVVQFYNLNVSLQKHKIAISKTIKHFVEEGHKKQVISRIIKRYNDRGKIDYHKKSGRPSSFDSKKFFKLFESNPEMSTREAARVLGISESTIQRFKQKSGIKCYKKQSVPKYSGNQEIYRRILESGGNKILE